MLRPKMEGFAVILITLVRCFSQNVPGNNPHTLNFQLFSEKRLGFVHSAAVTELAAAVWRDL
jgi:hypothetical protein